MTNELLRSSPQPIIPPGIGLFIGILAVSTASLFIRFAQTDVPSVVIAAGRMTLAAFFLAPYVLIRQRSVIKQIKKRDWLLLSLGGMFLGFHYKKITKTIFYNY